MRSEDTPALPPGLDLLWGRRGGGTRGPKPGLSVDAIVRTAVAVADAEGLDAVSMARVANELGFTTMSLYRHVTSKDELLQLMWNASAEGAEELALEGDGWRARLRNWALVQREMLDRHPWITQMPMAAPPMAPNSLTFVEKGLEALDVSGLADPRTGVAVSGDTLFYAASTAKGVAASVAHVLVERGAQHASTLTDAATPSPSWTFELLLRELIDQPTYPRLHRIVWSEEIGDGRSGSDEQEEYEFGLDRILDGVQTLIDSTQKL